MGRKETALNCVESAKQMEEKKSSKFGIASLTSNIIVYCGQMWRARNPMACLKFAT